jgi:hypothetical protein
MTDAALAFLHLSGLAGEVWAQPGGCTGEARRIRTAGLAVGRSRNSGQFEQGGAEQAASDAGEDQRDVFGESGGDEAEAGEEMRLAGVRRIRRTLAIRGDTGRLSSGWRVGISRLWWVDIVGIKA